VKYIYQNASSFNRPKSDVVKNARILSKLCAEIIGDTTKSKDDVSRVYHQLTENFAWSSDSSSSSSDGSESDGSDEEDPSAIPSSSNAKQRKRQALSTSGASKSSPPNLNPKKWKKDCMALLDEMNGLPFSAPFRVPVSAIDFPDYHRYIATPMDLSTVRESLLIGDYGSPLDFQKDMDLIFQNSRKYNTNSNSKGLRMTNRLEEWCDVRMISIVKDWRKTKSRLSPAQLNCQTKQPMFKRNPLQATSGLFTVTDEPPLSHRAPTGNIIRLNAVESIENDQKNSSTGEGISNVRYD